MNTITMKLQADHLIMEALREDISSEDVTTNAVMKEAVPGEVDLICKQDGIIAGLLVFQRVFELLDENVETEFYCKDGDTVSNGQLMGKVRGDIRVLLPVSLINRSDVTGCFIPVSAQRLTAQGCIRTQKSLFPGFLFFSDTHSQNLLK